MKIFEERYTAWIDGKLTGPELEAFERELPDRAEADADKRAAEQLRRLLRQYGGAPALGNADFFNHQLRRRMEVPLRGNQPEPWRWSIPRLAWAGAVCLLIAAALFKGLVPTGDLVDREPQYFAKITSANAADPSIYATTVYAPEDHVTVIWLDGLDYLPASYTLK